MIVRYATLPLSCDNCGGRRGCGLGFDLFLQLGGDEIAVQDSRDGRVSGPFEHRRQFARSELVPRPLRRVRDDRGIAVDPNPLVSRPIKENRYAWSWTPL
jgi:hypothetical protein